MVRLLAEVVSKGVGVPSRLNPKHPVDVAGSLQVPVLGLCSAKGTDIPLDCVDRLKAGVA